MAFFELNITSVTNLQEQLVGICSNLGWSTSKKNADGTFNFKPKDNSPEFKLSAETSQPILGVPAKLFTLGVSATNILSRCDAIMTTSKAWVKVDEWGLFCVLKTHTDSTITWFTFGCFEDTTDCYVLGFYRSNSAGNTTDISYNGVSSLWRAKSTVSTTFRNYMIINGTLLYISYVQNAEYSEITGFHNSNIYRNCVDNNLCLITGVNVIARTPLIYTLNGEIILDRMVPYLFACSTKNVECFTEISYNNRKFMIFPLSSLNVPTHPTYVTGLTVPSGTDGFALEIT